MREQLDKESPVSHVGADAWMYCKHLEQGPDRRQEQEHDGQDEATRQGSGFHKCRKDKRARVRAMPFWHTC